MIRPWHPFTKDSQQPVRPNQPTEYKIEIYPTSADLKAGDRLRLTIGTANTFSSAPPLPDLGNELGGTITLLHGGRTTPTCRAAGRAASSKRWSPARRSRASRESYVTPAEPQRRARRARLRRSGCGGGRSR